MVQEVRHYGFKKRGRPRLSRNYDFGPKREYTMSTPREGVGIKYMPTEEDIARETALIRATWTKKEHELRLASSLRTQHVLFEEVHVIMSAEHPDSRLLR